MILGGGGGATLLPGILADPPIHQIRKFFLGGKMKFIKGARRFQVHKLFVASDPSTRPPTPGIVSTGH